MTNSKLRVGLPSFVELLMKLSPPSGVFELVGEDMSGVQGTNTQYVDKQGVLLGARLRRQMTTRPLALDVAPLT